MKRRTPILTLECLTNVTNGSKNFIKFPIKRPNKDAIKDYVIIVSKNSLQAIDVSYPIFMIEGSSEFSLKETRDHIQTFSYRLGSLNRKKLLSPHPLRTYMNFIFADKDYLGAGNCYMHMATTLQTRSRLGLYDLVLGVNLFLVCYFINFNCLAI